MDLSYLESLMGAQETYAGGDQGIWVVGETAGGELAPLSISILGKARELANALGAGVKGILFGLDLAAPAERMIRYGADAVTLFDDPLLAEYGLEPYAAALVSLMGASPPEIILFGATSLGGELAPRLAQRFGGPCFTQCVNLGLDEVQRALVATHPMLGGEYYEIAVSPTERPQFATVAAGAFPIPYPDEYRFGEVTSGPSTNLPPAGAHVLGPAREERPIPPLKEASIVVCAGRGLQDEEGLHLAEALASVLGGQLAGTRGACDEGWIPADRVIGVGGETVRPALYIGCGVSGAIQHVMGMQGAGYVLAINRDPRAEIFQYADLGVVGDAKEVLRALNDALRTP